MRRVRLGTAVVTAAALAGLAACGGSESTSSSSAEAPPMSATAVQYREDQVAGIMKILLDNESEEELLVETLRLEWPGLTTAEDAELDYPLRPGEAAALKIPFGDAVCADDPPPTDDAVAVMTLADVGEVRLPITEGLQTLTRIHDQQCLQRELTAAVDLSFAPAADWQLLDVGGLPVLRGVLNVNRRTFAGDIVLDGAQGSVVLTPTMTAPATSPWLALPAGTDVGQVSVDVAITGRCGGHVLGEVKKPYEFEVFVDIGDGLKAYAVPSEGDLQLRMREEVFFPGCGVSS